MSSCKVPNRGPTRLTLVVAVLVVLSSMLLAADPLLGTEGAGEADALRPVSLAISLYPRGDNGNVVDILTGPGTTGMASARGKVDLFRSARALRTRVLANLYLESSRPDIVRGSVNPKILDFDPQSKFNHTDIIMNFFVSYPMLNYSSSVGGLIKVRIWGDWFTPFSQGVESWSSGVIEDFYVYINVKPFHYLDLQFDPPVVQVRPGEPMKVDVIVRNRGNGYERVELSIPSETAYAMSGWSFEFESTVIEIPPHSEGKVEMTVVPPRRQQLKYHMEMLDFNVRAVSHNSKFQVLDGDRTEENWFEFSFSVYMMGLDAVFVPFTWTLILYLLFIVIMFNFGINMFTLRKRRLPRGKHPGFIALYHLASDPAKREERARSKKLVKEQRRKEAEERRLAVDEERRRSQQIQAQKARPLTMSPLQRREGTDEDFDIELPPAAVKAVRSEKGVSDKAKQLRPEGRKGKEGFESEVLDILGSLDDD